MHQIVRPDHTGSSQRSPDLLAGKREEDRGEGSGGEGREKERGKRR